jgi:hypothetical protein
MNQFKTSTIAALICAVAALVSAAWASQASEAGRLAMRLQKSALSKTERQKILKTVAYSDVVSAAHGVVSFLDGRRIEPDAALAERLVDTLLADLSAAPAEGLEKTLDANDPATSAALEAIARQRKRAAANAAFFRETLEGYKFADADERILTKLLLAESALDRKARRLQALKDYVSGDTLPSFDAQIDRLSYIALGINRYGLYEINPALLEYWGSRNLNRWLEILRDRLRVEPTYVQTCADNGVPAPPDWPGAGWAPLQRLDYNLNLLQSGTDTKVAIHEVTSGPQEGLCIGLPRTNGSFTTLFGIICQSKQTGKACFYDNIDQSGRRISGFESSLSLRISDLQNGDTLTENCTDCHRGGNAFLVTPGTPLQNPLGRPLVRYSPVSSQPAWVNPAWHTQGSTGPTGAVRACAVCHEIPEPSRAYCDRVLEQAARRTMPNPTGPAGWWPSPAAGYIEHMREFFAVCLPPHLARS